MTITEFLTARLDEAQTAAEGRDSEAPIHQVGCYYYHQQFDPRQWTAEHCDCEESAKAYILADIAAKRAIVRLYEGSGLRITMGQVLRALAQPYAEHPDFDPAWRAG